METFTEDFNNSGFTQVLGQENYDLVVERRGAQSSALKFSGGLYKPFAGSLRNIYRNVQTVGVNGVPITNNVIETGLAFIAPTSQATFGLSPAQLANSNVQTASLIRSNINGVTNLFSVERVATGDCGTKTANLVINTGTYGAQGTDCGPVTTSLVTSNLFELSRTGELFMQFVESAGGAPVTSTSQPVRIQPFRSTTLAGDFPALDQVSLANLRTFTNSTTLQQVAVTLVVPTGKQKVCITTELDGVPICVRATRQVNLSVDQLSKAPVYLVTAEDSAGNLYQRRYLLN